MTDIARRKDEHLDICREDQVESGLSGGLQDWRLDYLALPELALEDIDLRTAIAGKGRTSPRAHAARGGHVRQGAVAWWRWRAALPNGRRCGQGRRGVPAAMDPAAAVGPQTPYFALLGVRN